MKLRLSYIILRAVAWHRGSYLTLALVVALIASVITASLLAGYSVRQTLAGNTIERLNGTGIMVSAGLRYADRDMAADLSGVTGVKVAPVLEVNGTITSFGGTQNTARAKIWGVDSSFFAVGGEAVSDAPDRGSAVINSRLAEALNVKEGESIIVRFQPPSDLPGNTPFAPGKEEEGSLFLTVKKITTTEKYGLFNPSISQVVPLNIFVSINEFDQFLEGRKKGNGFLLAYDPNLDIQSVGTALESVSIPGGQSLRIREVPATGEMEIFSDRIFIDDFVVTEITENIEGASPVLTWLANSISSASGSTPYSFISAVPGDHLITIPGPFDIMINGWLAADLSCGVGDSVTVSYFLSGDDNQLTETCRRFRVSTIVPLVEPWRDSLLMPAFPGITGSRSCTDWDAGIPLDMKRIRDKDEQYWDDHAGTPKAFIRYSTAVMLWGNQFGAATAIRVKGDKRLGGISNSAQRRVKGDGLQATGGRRLGGISNSAQRSVTGDGLQATGGKRLGGISNSAQRSVTGGGLEAKLQAIKSIGGFGFTVSDLRADGLKAATSGVDFSTLFLSLSFFIILSALVLLIMVMDNHLRTREGEIAAYTALGFRGKTIRGMFLGEAIVPLIVGAIAGAVLGIVFNTLIIKALNSVWIGAVQTDTLRPYSGVTPILTGLFSTIFVALLSVRLRIGAFLRRTARSVRERAVPHGKVAGALLLPVFLLTLLPVALLIFTSYNKLFLHFIGGALLFALFLLFFRWIVTRRYKKYLLSLRYYAFYPSRALTPILFIATGLFIVITTGSNRKDFGKDALRRDSGTGGFTHWIETTIPVDLNFKPAEAGAFMHCLRVDGDDASCLNLNHITSPHVLGVDAGLLSERGSFSFASSLPGVTDDNSWDALPTAAGEDAIYGFLDQTVMQWGMKVKPGDTVTIRSESGQPLHIIIAGGFKTSVFQGYLVIDKSHFVRWFPSVAGSNVILAEMTVPQDTASAAGTVIPALEPYGASVEATASRLESFNRVTNTYLSVFVVLGGIGMILGVTGLGLNLVRNIRSRRKEFTLLSATGYTIIYIRRMLLTENLVILLAGTITGTIPAIYATWPSIAAGSGLPWMTIIALVSLMLLTGSIATLLSIRGIRQSAGLRA